MTQFIINSGANTAMLEVGSGEFAVKLPDSAATTNRRAARVVQFTVTGSSCSVSLSLAPKAIAKEAQTERLNKALVLGYMPALRETSSR